MAYRYDTDLEFLGNLTSDELNDLVYILTHDKDGNKRLTEWLTLQDSYKQYYPQHHKYWKEIAEEIQLFGGNTISNLFRFGKGVLYREVLCDVCDQMKVNYNSNSSTKQIEQNLLMKVLEESLEKMSSEEIKALGDEVGIKNINSLTKQGISTAFIAIFRAGGFQSYKLTLIIVNAVMKALIGRGLPLVVNASVVQTMGWLTGPIGWAITGVWTLSSLAGPAYRITIPAVIQIAYLRSLYENKDAIKALESK